ncbi:MAG: glycine cleavage system protein GcvH [Bacteroidia bacterium]|nr:glycine cleavage system protein GcvH [Bacteroidia bacterium]
MYLPENLLYTKEHEWVRLDGDIATIGITDFAQSELGDIVYVEIETLHQSVERGGIFGTVEAVKTVSDLFMPLLGTVIAVNEKLNKNPELVNSDPYGEGWMIRVQLEEGPDGADLLTSSEYTKMVGA